MGFRDTIKQHCIGRVTFPLSQYLMNRRNILPQYRSLLNSETCPPEQLQRMQLEKLRRVIGYAGRYVPYYRRMFKEAGVQPQDIRSLHDLSAIPLLSRYDVIEHHRDMVDERLRPAVEHADAAQREPGEPLPLARFRRHRLVRNTSSGSTGAPTVFYEDGSRTALNWAYELRLKHWYGVRPGAREARLVRNATVYASGSPSNRLRRLLWNQLILPGISLSEREYDLCLEAIASFCPEVLWGPTSALAGLARHINREEGPLPYRPRMVCGWSEPVYEHEKEVMGRAFGCPVTNIYSAREVGHIAALCPEGAWHVNQENLIVESVREGTDDGPGELVVSNLDCTPMPFIRYRMGDVGAVRSAACVCGRTLQVIDSLLGRTGEMFTTKSGRVVATNFWCRTVSTVPGAIRRFQVIYTRSRDVRLRIEKDTDYGPDTERYIRETVRRNFSDDTALEFEYVPEIKPMVSGKYQMIINESASGSDG
jgi:phenylacetate-CoA ligase